MPAVSEKQQQFMGAELARKRAGKATKTHMTEAQLEEFASTKRKGLPKKAKHRKVHKAQEGTVVRARDLVLEGLREE